MGKGGGCVPSKKRMPLATSDNPPKTAANASITVADKTLTANATPMGKVTISSPAAKLKIFIVYYSMYGHVEGLAKGMKKGIDGIKGTEGFLYHVPEILSNEILKKMKAPPKDESIPLISVVELALADGFLFGFSTRYRSMVAQMKSFFDSTGQLWKEQKLAGKPVGFFVSTGKPGGGQ